MFGLFSTPKRKTSKAARVKKLAAKVAKLENKRKLDAMEKSLRAKYAKMRGL